MRVSIRPWTIKDAAFCCYVRNHPDLMRWFRQNKKIELEEQKDFITKDLANREYNGNVILANNKPVGLCGVKTSQEFTIAVLPEWQKKGIATKAMQLLIKQHPQIWSEVFVGNPALEWYVAKLGFRITGVREREYYKSNIGLIDTVKIQHE
jgi:RimJ/RimL family protein N-acetyltransferase